MPSSTAVLAVWAARAFERSAVSFSHWGRRVARLAAVPALMRLSAGATVAFFELAAVRAWVRVASESGSLRNGMGMGRCVVREWGTPEWRFQNPLPEIYLLVRREVEGISRSGAECRNGLFLARNGAPKGRSATFYPKTGVFTCTRAGFSTRGRVRACTRAGFPRREGVRACTEGGFPRRVRVRAGGKTGMREARRWCGPESRTPQGGKEAG